MTKMTQINKDLLEDIQRLGQDIAAKKHIRLKNIAIREDIKLGRIKTSDLDKKRYYKPNSYDYKIKYVGDYVEVKEYSEPIASGYTRKHNPKRKEGRTMANKQNVARARRKIFDIVSANITKYSKLLTLTYAETMLDYDRLRLDFQHLRQYLKRKGYDFEYLYVVEHQKERGKREGNEGSLHIHAVLFTDKFIPFDIIKENWKKHGSVDIQAKFDKAPNKGAYIAKYINKESMPADKKAYRVSRKVKRPTFKAGLGSVDIVHILGREYAVKDSYDYKVYRGINQETGEIKEDISCKQTTLVKVNKDSSND